MSDETKNEELHVISVLVENEFGVLARVAGLFASRSFNIESLTVGPTQDPSMSRMTIMVKGERAIIDQVEKQLIKLIEVVAVKDLSESSDYIARELLFIKVACNPENRVEIMKIGELFQAEAIDYTPGSLTFQIVGSPKKMDNFLTFMEPYEILEMARSGAVGINRGAGGVHTEFREQLKAFLESGVVRTA